MFIAKDIIWIAQKRLLQKFILVFRAVSLCLLWLFVSARTGYEQLIFCTSCDITAHLSHHQPLMCFSLLHVSLNTARKWPKYLGSLSHVCISTDTIFTATRFPPGAAGLTLLHKIHEQQYTSGTVHPRTVYEGPQGNTAIDLTFFFKSRQ